MDKNEVYKMQQYTCHENIECGSFEDSYITEIKEDLIKCPECFQLVSQKELDKFGGLCEVCMDDLMID